MAVAMRTPDGQIIGEKRVMDGRLVTRKVQEKHHL